MIKARMRGGPMWSDACILNLSRRGMLVQAQEAPTRGSFLEIRRGRHVVIARVVWARANRFGIRTQDDVPAEHLAGDDCSTNAGDPAHFVERRVDRWSSFAGEKSRINGRAMEFLALALLAATAAFHLLGLASRMMGRPLAAVGSALH